VSTVIPALRTVPAMDEKRQFSRRSLLVLGGGVALGGLAVPAVARDKEDKADGIRLAVITANIGRRHLEQRRPAIEKVRNAQERPLVGWQEIGEGAGDTGEKPMIEHFFGPRYNNVNMAGKVPVSVPDPWRVTFWEARFASAGLAEWSPTRYITEVRIEHASNPELKFTFLNMHYIANAWNGLTDPLQGERRARWNNHYGVHRDRVQAYHQQGRTVIWTGDVNNRNMPKVHNQERQAFPNGIDKVNWIPGTDRVRISLERTEIIDLNVDDHDARMAVFSLRLA
jgi:hypothetical protein